ncbi:MAG TPA: hypothetical protein VF246_01420 [Acidimicrobiia bacterium]
MRQYAVQFADFLESLARRVRSVTVDRVARLIRASGLGILVATLGFATLIFLVWTLFGALEIPLTTAGAYGVLGAVLVGVGGFMWFTRSREK